MDDTTVSIVQRALAGDAWAFDALYRQYHRRVLGLCRYMLGSSEDARDAANDVFARLHMSIGTYDASLPFQRWLLSVTSNHCVDLLRRRARESRIFEAGESDSREWTTPDPSPLDEMMSSEQRDTVRSALASLPERYRVPITLRYYSDLSYDEIAAALKLTRANVATLVFRAKKELRRTLARKEGTKPGDRKKL
jgi:RNA polymerase sigma-70 factor (ECF subfamily)